MSYQIAVEDEVLTSEKVLLALERVLTSSMFLKSTRLSQFLRFAVERTLEGKGGELKEYAIATQVYDRKDDFDPAVDTIVRSEARRLRRKLKEYYDTEGKRDAVVLAFLPGSYVPVNRLRSVPPAADSPSEETVSIVVEPFECNGANALAWQCAFGISDEILHHLASCLGIRVICGSGSRAAQNTYRPEEAIYSTRTEVVIRGTVRAHDNLLRVTTRATTADSRLLWSHQIDSLAEGNALLNLQERVASDVVTHINSWLSGPRRLESVPGKLGLLCLDPMVSASRRAHASEAGGEQVDVFLGAAV